MTMTDNSYHFVSQSLFDIIYMKCGAILNYLYKADIER